MKRVVKGINRYKFTVHHCCCFRRRWLVSFHEFYYFYFRETSDGENDSRVNSKRQIINDSELCEWCNCTLSNSDFHNNNNNNNEGTCNGLCFGTINTRNFFYWLSNKSIDGLSHSRVEQLTSSTSSKTLPHSIYIINEVTCLSFQKQQHR